MAAVANSGERLRVVQGTGVGEKEGNGVRESSSIYRRPRERGGGKKSEAGSDPRGSPAKEGGGGR